MNQRFYDDADGGFYFTDRGADDLIVRQKIGSDSPLPSGNAVAAMVMLEMNGAEIAADTLRAFAGQMEDYGEGASAMIEAAMKYVRGHGPLEVSAGEGPAERPDSPEELAAKVLAVEPVWIDGKTLDLRCELREGYHIDAPIHVALNRPGSARVPEGAGIFGKFLIGADFEESVEGSALVTLSYQACDESACLPMISRSIEVFARSGDLG